MTPTVTLCRSSSMGMQSCEAMMGYAKRRPASGIWLSQPSTLLLPMSTTVPLSSGKKGSSHSEAAVAAALDVNLPKQEEAALASPALALPALAAPVCETPKSKKHRLPVVDVDLCPPAPKKGCRDHCRLPVACSGEQRRSNFHQKLNFSPGYLF